MKLPAFAAECRCRLSIDIFCPRGAQQQTRRTPLLLSLKGIIITKYSKPCSPAFSMKLPAFAAECRCLLSIDIFCRRGAQQQTYQLLLSIDGTYRRTDRRSTRG